MKPVIKDGQDRAFFFSLLNITGCHYSDVTSI